MATTLLQDSLTKAENIRNETRPPEGIIGSIGNYVSSWFVEAEHEPLPNAYLRSSLVVASSCFLLGELYVFQESYMAYIKAGLSIKRGYDIFNALWNDIKDMDHSLIDKHTLGGIRMG